jgi:hypothetical protein
MKRHPVSIDEAVGAVGAELGSDGTEHPSARELTAYHHGELPPEDTERIRDHLALCRHCADLVLDFASFGEPEAEAVEGGEGLPAVWESLRSRLGDEKPSPATVIPFPRRAPPRLPRSTLIAASLLAAVFGGWTIFRWQSEAATAERLARAEARIAELERDRDELVEPQLLVPVADLFPPSYQRGSDEVPTLGVPRAARIFVLQLHLADPGTHPDYSLRIVSADGEEIWSGTGLRQTSAGHFRIALPRRLLPAGRYGIELYGASEGQRTRLERYDLAIASPMTDHAPE